LNDQEVRKWREGRNDKRDRHGKEIFYGGVDNSVLVEIFVSLVEVELGSLVPHGHSGSLTIALTILNGGEVLSDLLLVASVSNVHLAGLHVLELWVILELVNIDGLSTDEENTLDVVAALFSEHAELSEGVLLEALKSLNETFKHVLEHVSDLAFCADLLVMKVPEGPTGVIDHLHHDVVTSASLILVVNEQSLEVVDDEWGGGKGIKWVAGGLLLLLDGSGSSGLLGNSDLIDSDDGLHGLLGHLDLSEDGDELGKGGNATKPGAGLGGGLGEALVKDHLESHGESAGEVDVSEGDVGSNEPVSGEGRVDGTEAGLNGSNGFVEHWLGDFLVVSEDGIDGGHHALKETRLEPVHPLVDLGALDGVGAEEGGVTVGKEFADGVGLLEVALGGLKDGELVGGVECLVCGGLSLLFGVNDNGDALTGQLGGDSAHVNEDVSGGLGVKFL